MKPAKGDVLTIFCKELSIDFILNKSVFVLPLGNHLFKVGATYDWLKLNDIPDTKAKEELIIKLNKIIPYPFQIVSHEAGVRPAVIDRRPVIGNHPEYENLIVFNGFGTKAVMLVPYFAKQLVNNLINNQTVSEEVDLNRFYSI
jgi:glycine/D-amino acid oxidase-like deaminating enzyme